MHRSGIKTQMYLKQPHIKNYKHRRYAWQCLCCKSSISWSLKHVPLEGKKFSCIQAMLASQAREDQNECPNFEQDQIRLQR